MISVDMQGSYVLLRVTEKGANAMGLLGDACSGFGLEDVRQSFGPLVKSFNDS